MGEYYMPYPKEFPHILLKIGRAFTQGELTKIMGLRMAQATDHAQAAKYSAARSDLADTRKRLEYEILLPSENADLEKELNQLLPDLVKTDFLPEECPRLPLPTTLFNVNTSDLQADFEAIPLTIPALNFPDAYDDVAQIKLAIVFDK
jgi:hypothetical protein